MLEKVTKPKSSNHSKCHWREKQIGEIKTHLKNLPKFEFTCFGYFELWNCSEQDDGNGIVYDPLSEEDSIQHWILLRLK